MADANQEKNNKSQDWLRVDARILGQILAAQNILFVLPDESRIAEYFSQALSGVPGIYSCIVCLGYQSAQDGVPHDVCIECATLRKKRDGALIMPNNFSCGLASKQDMRIITLKTNEHTFGFFIFQTDSTNAFEPYWPFLSNLANYVTLSLENRMQKHLLENSRNDLEDKVKERTKELLIVNTHLEEEIEVRKRTEKALQQSEEHFRFLFETMAQGVIVQDAESKIFDTNNGACKILGLTKDQLLGKTAYDPRWKLVHENGSPLYPSEMPSNIALRTCKPVTDILIGAYIPEQNIYHWILTSSTPKFREGESKPYLTMTTFSNITERRYAEEALSKSEREFRTLTENSPDVIVRYDREGQRTYVNPEFERVNHLTAQQVYGRKPVELSTELSPMAVVFTEKLMGAMALGTVAKIDLSWTKDGKPICWFVRIVPEFDADGKVASALTIWSDITERKQAEEEIRILNQELELRVVNRTAQLEAANKELEAFAYSVSHDLRAPLRGIDGFSQVLLEEYQDKIDAQGKNYLQRVRSAAQRMAQLIDDMLNLSRVSRGEINFHQVNLSEIAQEIADNLHGTQPERQVKFIIHEGIKTIGDGRLLRIVLENLIGNSWKFTSKHPTACIEFGVQQQKERPVYYVHDDGAGFDKNYTHKLFGAFQRLHTTKEFPGTGVGLATVQRVIHRHGGNVWAEGEIEKGATFYFTIT